MQDTAEASATTDVFKALADPTRRQILQDLREGELAAGDIASRFPISGPSISRHLSVLRTAGLVTERRDANRILYSLVGDRLALSVGDFLSAVCPEQIVVRGIRSIQGRTKAVKASAKSGSDKTGGSKTLAARSKGDSAKAGSAAIVTAKDITAKDSPKDKSSKTKKSKGLA